MCPWCFSNKRNEAVFSTASISTSLTLGGNMPTKKKATKKASAKKAAPKAATHNITFALDATQAAAIRRCLAKGTLRVKVSKADLLRGRVKDPWLYD
jgi:hypothetical protein